MSIGCKASFSFIHLHSLFSHRLCFIPGVAEKSLRILYQNIFGRFSFSTAMILYVIRCIKGCFFKCALIKGVHTKNCPELCTVGIFYNRVAESSCMQCKFPDIFLCGAPSLKDTFTKEKTAFRTFFPGSFGLIRWRGMFFNRSYTSCSGSDFEKGI